MVLWLYKKNVFFIGDAYWRPAVNCYNVYNIFFYSSGKSRYNKYCKYINNYLIQVADIWMFVVLFQLFCMFGKNTIFYNIFGWHRFIQTIISFGIINALTITHIPVFLFSFSEKAYLNRVAFYGLKGRYSKAILNCNEAINIYPQSVRAYIYRGVLKYHNRVGDFLSCLQKI